METVNALELRQSLGKVLDRLEQDGGPIVVCRRRTPAAALVSLKDYRERFVDRDADEQRRDVVARLRQPEVQASNHGHDSRRAARSTVVIVVDASVAIKWFVFRRRRVRSRSGIRYVLGPTLLRAGRRRQSMGCTPTLG